MQLLILASRTISMQIGSLAVSLLFWAMKALRVYWYRKSLRANDFLCSTEKGNRRWQEIIAKNVHLFILRSADNILFGWSSLHPSVSVVFKIQRLAKFDIILIQFKLSIAIAKVQQTVTKSAEYTAACWLWIGILIRGRWRLGRLAYPARP